MSVLQSGITKSLAVDYDIDNSLRFEDGDSAFLSRTMTSAGNQRVWTLSFWFKPCRDDRSGTSGHDNIFAVRADATHWDSLQFYNNKMQYEHYSESTICKLRTTQVFSDHSAWYHVVLRNDTTLAAAGDRMRMYVNGEEITAFDTDTNPSLNMDWYWNDGSSEIRIGQFLTTKYYDGYLAEVYLIDGSALAPSSFGETNATTNQWIPLDSDDVKDAVTFGTNGFYQKYGATELANSFTDSSSARTSATHTVSANGNVHTDTSVKEFGSASAQFDGTGDYLSIPASSSWDMGPSSWTWECWIRLDNVADQMGVLVSGDEADDGWRVLGFHPSNGIISNRSFANGQNDFSINQGSMTLSTDTWYHIACVREDTTVTLYLEGSQVAQSTGITGSFDSGSSTNIVTIGAQYNNAGTREEYLTGYVDEVRVSSTARYTGSTYTVPTTAFTADADTLLLLHMDGSDSGTSFPDDGPHTITAVGDVTNSRAQKKVGDSSIEFDGSGDYLSVAAASDMEFSSTDPFTLETWIRFDALGAVRYFFSGTGITVSWDSGYSYWQAGMGSGWGSWTNTPSVDTWVHVAIVGDGSNVKTYFDGTERISYAQAGTVGSTSVALLLGTYNATTYPLDGYMDEIRLSDIARYTTTFTPSTTAFTTDSNTVLLIHSNWNGGFGADSSGNNNTFAATNLVATDQMVDTPTNNIATLNPLCKGSVTYSEGNLKAINTAETMEPMAATMSLSSGKWYWEQRCRETSTTDRAMKIGVVAVGSTAGDKWFNGTASPHTSTSGYIVYEENGEKRVDGTTSSYGTAYTDNIIGVALDLDAGTPTVNFYNNNVSQGALTFTGNMTGKDIVPAFVIYNIDAGWDFNFGSDSSFNAQVTAQGNQDGNSKGDFYYTPPTDYLALCSDNLSAPEIALPGENFNTVLYAGNSSTQSITGVGFQPDFQWMKQRTGTESLYIMDAVRGPTYAFMSNSDEAQNTPANWVSSFNSDGWTMGSETAINATGSNYVTWCLKAGGAPTADNSAGAGATPTAGSVKIDGSNLGSALAGTTAATRLSANTTAGFSIVTYTGAGAYGSTVAHGLSQAPELILYKNLVVIREWAVYSNQLTSNHYYLALNTTAAEDQDTGRFNDTTPSATVFTLGDGPITNEDTKKQIAYCFHSVEGYSKVGSYTGNGNADGTFVYTGFSPAYVLIKNSGSTTEWVVVDNKRDPYNVTENLLYPDDNAVESTQVNNKCDLLSNGFKLRGNASAMNGAATIIFLAFAESPFKTSNAR